MIAIRIIVFLILKIVQVIYSVCDLCRCKSDLHTFEYEVNSTMVLYGFIPYIVFHGYTCNMYIVCINVK